jgi:hypothetical protein
VAVPHLALVPAGPGAFRISSLAMAPATASAALVHDSATV